jgi:hypothetical protein
MNPQPIKNAQSIISEYDLMLMEANRKIAMLSAAVAELQQENNFLVGELEKIKKEDTPESPKPKQARALKNTE